MTGIKFCGLSRPADIEAANQLSPTYIGFVFAKKSKRCVTGAQAKELKALLRPEIKAVGVFVNEEAQIIADLLNTGVIDLAQLHGSEGEAEIAAIRRLSDKPIIQAFQVKTESDVQAAQLSPADLILLDSGAGTGTTFDWEILKAARRPFFLAGGLSCGNVAEAVRRVHPFAVDVSSGIETEGVKDREKMEAFLTAVRREDERS